MPDDVSSRSEGRAVRGARARRRHPAALLAIIALAGCAGWVALSPLDRNDLVSGDEGFYGTMARNIVASPRYLVSPSMTPLDGPGDKPPFYPFLLSLSIRLLGPTEWAVRLPSVAMAAAIAALVGWMTASVAGAVWGGMATALLASLPWFADASRMSGGEIPVTFFGLLGIVLVVSAPRSGRRLAAAGALMGAAFLCKLWLVAPFALAATAVVLAAGPGRIRRLTVLAGVGTLVSASHLAAVAALRPEHLHHWFDMYWARAFVTRLGGHGFSTMWRQPPQFYWLILGHALVLVTPWIAMGVQRAWRLRTEPAALATLVWAACVLAFSAFGVKTGSYVYVMIPAWIALAALGLSAFAAGERPGAWVAVLLVAWAPPVVARLGEHAPAVGPWLAGWGVFAIAWTLRGRRVRPAPWLAAAATAAVIGLSALRVVQRLPQPYHVPGYRVAAAALEPMLRSAFPSDTTFMGPEVPAWGFYTFRTGAYWSTPGLAWTKERRERMEADTTLRVFMVDASRRLYGGWPDSSTLGWLERNTVEVTGLIERSSRRGLEFRVFVRRGCLEAARMGLVARSTRTLLSTRSGVRLITDEPSAAQVNSSFEKRR